MAPEVPESPEAPGGRYYLLVPEVPESPEAPGGRYYLLVPEVPEVPEVPYVSVVEREMVADNKTYSSNGSDSNGLRLRLPGCQNLPSGRVGVPDIAYLTFS
ncbi:hypothetical protein KDK_09060 [Dictyobacter kobayashii]|uniref:Uncharacterized protein n=1 Tax=Dictyobacter kobayashii TaxID=2014872 RepID=A0A402ADE3_9CHLR|nr:hypothetical protein KDK_09060 [Dictyobacter kobayashii]